MRRCVRHDHPRPCPHCARRGVGGSGRGQGRKSPHRRPVRILVTVERDALDEALARHPGSRSAAVRAVFLEGLAAPPEATPTATTIQPVPPPAPAVDPAVAADRPSSTRCLQKAFSAAYADVVTLRDQLHAGASYEVAHAAITRIRRHLSAMIAQLRRESRRGVVGTWFRRHGAPAHTQLSEPLHHHPRPWSHNDTWWECPAMLDALAAAAKAVEEGDYDQVLEILLPRIRHHLKLILRYYPSARS